MEALGRPQGRKPANPLVGKVERLERETRLRDRLDTANKVIEVQGNLYQPAATPTRARTAQAAAARVGGGPAAGAARGAEKATASSST